MGQNLGGLPRILTVSSPGLYDPTRTTEPREGDTSTGLSLGADTECDFFLLDHLQVATSREKWIGISGLKGTVVLSSQWSWSPIVLGESRPFPRAHTQQTHSSPLLLGKRRIGVQGPTNRCPSRGMNEYMVSGGKGTSGSCGGQPRPQRGDLAE